MLLAVAASLVPTALATDVATSPGVVVWTQEDVPPAEVCAKVEKQTGAASHVAWSDLAFARTPWGKSDDAHLAALEQTLSAARSRWDQFDVELAVANDLAASTTLVESLRGDDDRKLLVDALLLEGAAALRVVPDARFSTAPELATLRRELGGRTAPSALLDVVALEPSRVWTRSDVPDAATLARLTALQVEVRAQPRATIRLGALPGDVTAVLDGRPYTGSEPEVSVEPGHHYLHLVIHDKIAARQEFDVEAAGVVELAVAVSRKDLEVARTRVLAGGLDVPDTVARAANGAGARTKPPSRVFLAALDDKGNATVLPFANGAALQRERIVTVLLTGTFGGGVLLSPAYTGRGGELTAAPAFGGDLGFEIGITYAVVYGGTTLLLTPSEQMKFANDEKTENVETNAYVRPYGGIGLYLPRPDADAPLLFLGGNYGWTSPGTLGFGARLAFGVPLSGDGTWLRFVLDGTRGTQMAGFPGEGEPVWGGALRIGFGRLL